MEKLGKLNVTLRKGERSDCESIAGLIKELAEYEKQPDEAILIGTDLERDGFDSEPPYFYTIVAELADNVSEANGKIIGYIMYYYSYNLWSGKDIHLEDLYVKQDYRFKGVGEKLMKELSKVAIAENMPRISFECLDWNEPSVRFYKKHGAKDLTVENNWHNYRYTNSTMKQLARRQ